MNKILDFVTNVALAAVFFAAALFALRYNAGNTVPGKEDFIGLVIFFAMAAAGLHFAKEAVTVYKAEFASSWVRFSEKLEELSRDAERQWRERNND